MPLRMIEKTKRDQEVFVESWHLVGMFTCLLWLSLQVSEEETEAPFVLSIYSLSPDQHGWGPALSRYCNCLILPSVNQSE